MSVKKIYINKMKQFIYDDYPLSGIVEFYEDYEGDCFYFCKYNNGELAVSKNRDKVIFATYTGFSSFEIAVDYVKSETQQIVDYVERLILNLPAVA